MTMDPVAQGAQENSNQKFYCETITVATLTQKCHGHSPFYFFLDIYSTEFSHHLACDMNQKK